MISFYTAPVNFFLLKYHTKHEEFKKERRKQQIGKRQDNLCMYCIFL